MSDMKKAVVVGGSNGIGLAIAENLIRRGWRVIVLDRCEGDCAILPEGGWSYVPFDLLEFDGEKLKRYCGPTIYEVDGNKIKEYCGKNLYEVEGVLSRREWMALLAILFAS